MENDEELHAQQDDPPLPVSECTLTRAAPGGSKVLF